MSGMALADHMRPEFWQRYGNIAQITSAIAAVVGMAAILFQVNAIRTNSREATAQQIYLAYARLAFENPQFARPDYDRIKAAPVDDRTRYRTFVSLLMNACDEVLENISGTEWRVSCASDLKAHVRFLCEQADAPFLAQYSQRMRALVTAAMNAARASAEECKNRTS
jgi:hypothetical protein